MPFRSITVEQRNASIRRHDFLVEPVRILRLQLDRLLALLVDGRASRETAIARGFSADLVQRVTRAIVRSQFKRRPPIVAKVSLRSVGWDFRSPRDWQS